MTKTYNISRLTSLLSFLGLLAATGLVSAKDQAIDASNLAPDAVHGMAMHGAPKYPEGFSHSDYINAEAPIGGTLKMAVVANGFDSFNPFVIRGVAAAGVNNYLYDRS